MKYCQIILWSESLETFSMIKTNTCCKIVIDCDTSAVRFPSCTLWHVRCFWFFIVMCDLPATSNINRIYISTDFHQTFNVYLTAQFSWWSVRLTKLIDVLVSNPWYISYKIVQAGYCARVWTLGGLCRLQPLPPPPQILGLLGVWIMEYVDVFIYTKSSVFLHDVLHWQIDYWTLRVDLQLTVRFDLWI